MFLNDLQIYLKQIINTKRCIIASSVSSGYINPAKNLLESMYSSSIVETSDCSFYHRKLSFSVFSHR